MRQYLVYGKEKEGWTKDKNMMWLLFKTIENHLNDILFCEGYLTANRVREQIMGILGFEEYCLNNDARVFYSNNGQNYLTIETIMFSDGDYQLIIKDTKG